MTNRIRDLSDHIRSRHDEAQRDARSFTTWVQLPALGISIALFTAGMGTVVSKLLDNTGSTFDSMMPALAFIFPTAIAMMISVDLRYARATIGFIVAGIALCLGVLVYSGVPCAALLLARVGGGAASPPLGAARCFASPLPGAFALLESLTSAPPLLAALGLICAVSCNLFDTLLSERVLIDLALGHLSRLYALSSLAFLARTLVAAVLGRYDGPSLALSTGAGLLHSALGCALLCTDYRSQAQAWLIGRGEGIATARRMSAMLERRTPEEVQALAKRLFRSVLAVDVSCASLESNAPDPGLLALSSPAVLGCVDAFVTHSWHDDPVPKWEALQAWRLHFVAKHGREPSVFIDKHCLDCLDLRDGLACLPVFLAGCNSLLALAGHTWLGRLWCMLEVCVFLELGPPAHFKLIDLTAADLGAAEGPASPGALATAIAGSGPPEERPGALRVQAPPPSLSRAASSPGPRFAPQPGPERSALWQQVAEFDVRRSACSSEDAHAKLLRMIERCSDDLDRFNTRLRMRMRASLEQTSNRPYASPRSSSLSGLDSPTLVALRRNFTFGSRRASLARLGPQDSDSMTMKE